MSLVAMRRWTLPTPRDLVAPDGIPPLVARILAARGIEYRKYLDSEGLFDRAWPQYRKPIEESWAPYVRGEISRAEAIARTTKTVTP
jgi:hypothetical protein